MAEEKKPEPKISLVEFIFIGLYVLLLDAADFILTFFGIPGSDILDWFTMPIDFYMVIKGVSGTSFVIAQLLELIPYVGNLPFNTIGWCLVCYIDRHPKLEKITETIGAVAAIEEGATKGAEAGGAAEETAEVGAATEGAGAAAGAVEGGVSGAAAEAGEAGGGVAVGAEGEAGATAEAGEKTGASGEEAPTEEEAGEKEKEVEPEALGEEPEPMKKLGKELLENLPQEESEEEGEQEETPEEKPQNETEISEEKKNIKAQQVKEQLEKLKRPQDVTGENEQEEGYRKAA